MSIIASAIEPRLDGNPIVAELAQATWLSVGDSDRFVWIGQLGGVGALSLGSFALARRVGIPARGALMSALLVPTLPVVATQAVAAYNDLIVAYLDDLAEPGDGRRTPEGDDVIRRAEGPDVHGGAE